MSRSRPSQNKMKLLVELMANDPQLCSAKFTPSFTYKIAREKWENIAEQVNSLPGAQKSWDKWKKSWQDTRSTTKTKAAAIKRHISGIGGSPSCTIELSEIQKDALSLMSQTSVSGHIQSSESLVDFDFNDVSTEIVLIVSNGNENIQMPSSIAPNLISNENEKIKIKISSDVAPNTNLKRKANVAFGLGENNKTATRLGDISERKCDMKKIYYEKKLKLLEEQNSIFTNINTLLTTFMNDRSLKKMY